MRSMSFPGVCMFPPATCDKHVPQLELYFYLYINKLLAVLCSYCSMVCSFYFQLPTVSFGSLEVNVNQGSGFYCVSGLKLNCHSTSQGCTHKKWVVSKLLSVKNKKIKSLLPKLCLCLQHCFERVGGWEGRAVPQVTLSFRHTAFKTNLLKASCCS